MVVTQIVFADLRALGRCSWDGQPYPWADALAARQIYHLRLVMIFTNECAPS